MHLELTILGSASQAPTRERGQGGYVVRWEDELVLFDPGEGCQRQILFAGVSAAHITRVCITHFHGDHCLGLPGFVQSRGLVTDRPLALHYQRSEERFIDRLLGGTEIDFDLHLQREPLDPGQSIVTPRFELSADELEHPVPAVGYRLEGPGGMHADPVRAEALGLEGTQMGEILREGEIEHRGRTITLDEVADYRRGPILAFVMDTADCEGARRLAAGADVLICESTFLESEADLAAAHGHLTARGAASLAVDSGVGLLVLSHFSGRYGDTAPFEAEAREVFEMTVAARDLACIAWDTRKGCLVT
jgi:ribonuclease Z